MIAGLHRSGTTYVGNVLNQLSQVSVLHEPFNFRQGVRGAPPFYSYYGENAETDRQLELFADQVFCMRGEWNREAAGGKWLRRLGWRLTGSWPGVRWAIVKFRFKLGVGTRYVCWKDPFLTFMLPLLVRKYDAKVVFLIRHPCALYRSQGQHNWFVDFSQLSMQQGLFSQYLSDVSEDVLERAASDNALGIALLWKAMVRYIISQRQDGVELHLVRHEDLCATAVDVFRGVFSFLGIPFGDAVRLHIEKTTQGEATNVEVGMWRKSYFVRDSQSLAMEWREKVPPREQQRIIDLCQEELKLMGYEK